MEYLYTIKDTTEKKIYNYTHIYMVMFSWQQKFVLE